MAKKTRKTSPGRGLRGADLLALGWQSGPLVGEAVRLSNVLASQGVSGDEVRRLLKRVWESPESVAGDAWVAPLAAAVAAGRRQPAPRIDDLRDQPLPYRVWGAAQIDVAARDQMEVAMRLPVSLAGALMPDAHVGYGLPIGGVLATENSVIPYGIGVDIACRMRLTIFRQEDAGSDPSRLERALTQGTYFGAGVSNPRKPDHEVLHDPAWNQTPLVRSLRPTAQNQLGTSGSGNHFAEFGELEIIEPLEDLSPGIYLALLSHSGSRGVGFKIASHYTTVAKREHTGIEKEAANLSWLGLDAEAGQEYWDAMELAGRFASANHQVIHDTVADEGGLNPIGVIENHHNYAWKELVNGREAIVHRKGATPAGVGVLGVIPGSMADPGFVVRGRGQADSLNSAAHGAGRAMGRKEAQRRLTWADRDRYLAERGVKLFGGGLDEAPQAYKRIEDVIAAQVDLVEIIGIFRPTIVRMDRGGGQDI